MNQITIDVDDDTLQSIARVGDTQNLTAEQAAAYLLDRTLFGITRRMTVSGEDYRPGSVMVMIDESDDSVLKHYRCENCGNIVFDYCGATRLTANGQYDRDNQMVDGEDVTEDPFGKPTRIECQGRVLVQFANGRSAKVRCGYKYYKLRA